MNTGSAKTPDKAFERLIAGYSPEVQNLARRARSRLRKLVPDALEEVDVSSKMLALTYIPGTYKGAILAVAPQKNYVNIMFSKGVELMAIDKKGLLEGTGKLARHVKVRSAEQLEDPALRALVEEAAKRTQRTR